MTLVSTSKPDGRERVWTQQFPQQTLRAYGVRGPVLGTWVVSGNRR